MDSGRHMKYVYRTGTEQSQRDILYAAELRDYTYMINRLNRQNQSLSLNLVQLLNQNKALKQQLHQKRLKEYTTKQSQVQLKSYRNYLSRCSGSANKTSKLQQKGKSERQLQKCVKNNSVYVTKSANLSNYLKSPTIIEQLTQSKFTPHKKKGLYLSKQISQASNADNKQPRKQSQIAETEKKAETQINPEKKVEQNVEKSKVSQVSKIQQLKALQSSLKKTNSPYKVQLKKLDISSKKDQISNKISRRNHLQSMYSYLYSPIRTYNEVLK